MNFESFYRWNDSLNSVTRVRQQPGSDGNENSKLKGDNQVGFDMIRMESAILNNNLLSSTSWYIIYAVSNMYSKEDLEICSIAKIYL